MHSKSIISAKDLGKRYVLRHRYRGSNGTVREIFAGTSKRLTQMLLYGAKSVPSSAPTEEFWALKDVNFEIEMGARLGIIGRNGAGKSTLLKLLSRVTEPTTGSITLRGRVASLLEVGTGFHPELTGRENIFLNGVILGMTRDEVRRKFEGIVAFADIEQFLDTPVKRYSSGMYVRLAFAVAAHLDPEILIVDEVLAVGDAQFQKKCLGKMQEIGKQGRTVIFVTHNMDALVSLCNRGIVLQKGMISYNGDAMGARESYRKSWTQTEYSIDNNSGRGGSGGISIREVWLQDSRGKKIKTLNRTTAISLCVEVDVGDSFLGRNDVDFAFGVDSEDGDRLFTAISSWTNDFPMLRTSPMTVLCDLSSIPLVPGKYLLSASSIFRGDTLDSVLHCAFFEVIPEDGRPYAARQIDFGSLDLPCRFREYG